MIGLVLILSFGAIITLIVTLTRISEITSRIETLESKVSHLYEELQRADVRPEARTSVGTEPVHEMVQMSAEPIALATPAVSEPSPLVKEPAATNAPLFAPPPKAPSRTREEWEALIGGKLLNRIGALALVIGIGFFLKYAFDNNWLSETVRVLIGAAAGFLLLAGAAQSRKRGLLIFAQGLVGAGIAVLYLSVYSSFNYYHLVSQPIAFVLMAIVTVIAFTQAFLYDSIAVSMLGWIGGFLTPFMLSTGESNEIGLFSYIALLAAGLLVVVMKKEKWAILEPLTLAATYFIFFLWFGQEYQRDDFALTLFFALLFWALFFVTEIVHNLRSVEVLRELRSIAAGFNAALFYLALYLLIDHEYHAWMGTTTLGLGIVYLLVGLWMHRSNPDARATFARLMCTAIILFVLVPPIEFKRYTVVMYWSVEALLLAWTGRRWSLRFAKIAAFVLYILAGWMLLIIQGALFDISPDTHRLLLNMRSAGFATLAASMGIAGILLGRDSATAPGDRTWKLAPGASSILHFGWSGFLFVLFTVETNDFFRHLMVGVSGPSLEALSFQRFMTQAVVWASLAIVLAWVATPRKIAALAYSSIVVIFLAMAMSAIRGIAYVPVEEFTLVLNYRVLSLLLVIAGSFGIIALVKTMQGLDWGKECADIMGTLAVILILVLLTGETRDFFEKRLALSVGSSSDVAYPTDNLEDLKQLSLSGIWLLYSISLMGIGIWRRLRSLRIMAIVLFGVTILKIFIYDLSFLETLYRIFSFIGLGIVLLVVSYLYQHYKDLIFPERPKEEAEKEVTTA